MIYVRAIRDGDLLLYIDALTKIYARWIPVHLLDMVFLHDKHHGVFAEFRKGNYVVKKTTHVFSGIAIDQAHEQNNASVKDG